MKFEIVTKRDVIKGLILDELEAMQERFNDMSEAYASSTRGRQGKFAYADEAYGLSLRFNPLAEEYDRRYNQTTNRMDEKTFRNAFPGYDE